MNKMGLEYQQLMVSFKEILFKIKIKQLLRPKIFLTSKIILIINNQKMMRIRSLEVQMIKINIRKNLYHLDLAVSVDNITQSKQLVSKRFGVFRESHYNYLVYKTIKTNLSFFKLQTVERQLLKTWLTNKFFAFRIE